MSSADRSQGGSSTSLWAIGVTRSPQRITCEQNVRPPPNAGVSSNWRRIDTAFLQRLDQRNGYGRGRHVAVFLDGDEHAVHRHSGSLGDVLDDAQVGLVRNDQVDIGSAVLPQLRECFSRRLAHARDRAFEYFLTVEVPDRVAEGHVALHSRT